MHSFRFVANAYSILQLAGVGSPNKYQKINFSRMQFAQEFDSMSHCVFFRASKKFFFTKTMPEPARKKVVIGCRTTPSRKKKSFRPEQKKVLIGPKS
jgi:hypothetical protein